eukprot:1392231-Amorphochlora_amoeboformis.AAC.1
MIIRSVFDPKARIGTAPWRSRRVTTQTDVTTRDISQPRRHVYAVMALGRRVLWCVLVGILVVPWMDWGKEHREEYLGYRVSRKGGKKFKR